MGSHNTKIPTTNQVMTIVDKYKHKTDELKIARCERFNQYIIKRIYMKSLKTVERGKFTLIDDETIAVVINVDRCFKYITKDFHKTTETIDLNDFKDIHKGDLSAYIQELIRTKFPQSPQVKDMTVGKIHYDLYNVTLRLSLEICVQE